MIRLIAAIDRQRGIAKCGCFPWKIPSDERYFTRQTKLHGGITLTGRTTFDTFKRPLIGRRNYVLAHEPVPVAGVDTVTDVSVVLDNHADVWVVGGASVFEQTINRADELYLTTIDAMFGCDRFFPAYLADFDQVLESERQEENGFQFRFEVWRRKS